MLEPDFGFERYVRWLIDSVPMYFVYRDGRYIDVAGASFRDLSTAKCRRWRDDGDRRRFRRSYDHGVHRCPGQTLPGDARADAGRADMMVAQSALWVGLLYDEAALWRLRLWCAA